MVGIIEPYPIVLCGDMVRPSPCALLALGGSELTRPACSHCAHRRTRTATTSLAARTVRTARAAAATAAGSDGACCSSCCLRCLGIRSSRPSTGWCRTGSRGTSICARSPSTRAAATSSGLCALSPPPHHGLKNKYRRLLTLVRTRARVYFAAALLPGLPAQPAQPRL